MSNEAVAVPSPGSGDDEFLQTESLYYEVAGQRGVFALVNL